MSDDTATPTSLPATTADWADESARRWALVGDRVEAQLAPVDPLLFAAADLRTGERALDVGCGRGVTTRQAHDRVAPDGRVTGLDVSATLLAEAAALAGGRDIDWRQADAQRADLEPAAVDVVISRFGVMFFDDPVEAFANLASATRPGGRLALAVWQHRHRTPVLQHPVDVTAAAVRAVGAELAVPGDDAGPTSLGDPDRVAGILTDAGWSQVEVVPHDLDMYLCGPGTPEEIVEAATAFGTVRAVLESLDQAGTAAARAALADDVAARHDGTGVPLRGGIHIVTARRP